MYLDPIMWECTASHVAHKRRREHAISPDKLTRKVVDVAGHRLSCVLYEPQHGKALICNSLGRPWPGIIYSRVRASTRGD